MAQNMQNFRHGLDPTPLIDVFLPRTASLHEIPPKVIRTDSFRNEVEKYSVPGLMKSAE